MKSDAERIDELATALRTRHGIDPFGSVALRARFEIAIRELGNDVDAIAARLRVGETRFYRDGAQLEAVIATLGKREKVRVLSAGCSTGEEVYTLAIMLELAGVGFELVGLDTLPASITTARAGRYAASVRTTVPPRMRRFLTERGAEVEVATAIAARCRFSVGDLLTTPLFGPFDAIFCRNVLIYLEDDVALQLIGRLANALTPDGVLCVARAELGIARRAPGLLPTTLPGEVVVFNKQKALSIAPPSAAAGREAAVSPREELGPPSRVRLIIRREDRPNEITERGLGLLGSGSAIVEVTIIGTCDAARIAELATPLRRLSSAARALGGALRATDDNTSRVLAAVVRP